MKLCFRVETFGNATPAVAVTTGNRTQRDVISTTITVMADCHLPSVRLLCSNTVTSGTRYSKATCLLLWCHYKVTPPAAGLASMYVCACRFFSLHGHICRFISVFLM